MLFQLPIHPNIHFCLFPGRRTHKRLRHNLSLYERGFYERNGIFCLPSSSVWCFKQGTRPQSTACTEKWITGNLNNTMASGKCLSNLKMNLWNLFFEFICFHLYVHRRPHLTSEWWRLSALRDGLIPLYTTNRARDVIITSLLRQNDVATSFWRYYDVIITSCVSWVVNTWHTPLPACASVGCDQWFGWCNACVYLYAYTCICIYLYIYVYAYLYNDSCLLHPLSCSV